MIMNIPFYSSIGSFLSQHSRIGGGGWFGYFIWPPNPSRKWGGGRNIGNFPRITPESFGWLSGVLVIFLGSPLNQLDGWVGYWSFSLDHP